MNKKQKDIVPCGSLKYFTKQELIDNKPDKEHYCGLPKGHKGRHKCFYTDCKVKWGEMIEKLEYTTKFIDSCTGQNADRFTNTTDVIDKLNEIIDVLNYNQLNVLMMSVCPYCNTIYKDIHVCDMRK